MDDDDEEWYEEEETLRGSFVVIEVDTKQSTFTGLYDADGYPLYRTPVAKPSAGFLSNDDFDVDPDDEFYEPIDVSEHARISKQET